MKKLSMLALLCLNVGCGMENPMTPATSSRVILPMVSIREVNDLNAVMDSDKDQKISLAEFKAAVAAPGHPLAAYAKAPETLELRSQKYISALDQNKDGELSFAEASGEALYTLYFEAQDLNQNGILDQDEFKTYGDNLADVEAFKDKVIVNLMSHDKDFFLSKADENRDAVISQEEFLRFGIAPFGAESTPDAQCTETSCGDTGSPYAGVPDSTP